MRTRSTRCSGARSVPGAVPGAAWRFSKIRCGIAASLPWRGVVERWQERIAARWWRRGVAPAALAHARYASHDPVITDGRMKRLVGGFGFGLGLAAAGMALACVVLPVPGGSVTIRRNDDRAVRSAATVAAAAAGAYLLPSSTRSSTV